MRYRELYIKACKEIVDLAGKTNGDVHAFLKYHRSLCCAYFDALSLGKMLDLMDFVRRDEGKELSGCEKAAAKRIEKMLIEGETV